MNFKPQPMVNWYEVPQLWDTFVKTMLAGVFGDYTDRREMQAALSTEEVPTDQSKVKPGFDYTSLMKDGEAWFDYISDTGDGFGATHSVAYLAAQSSLPGIPASSRSPILVLGGDQVYPTPTREAYRHRFEGPFTSAYHSGNETKAFAIPGNHDWYDGLSAFLKLFCRQAAFGKLQTVQTRSYFSIKLTPKCWLWALDNQLRGSLDSPQEKYFKTVANEMAADGGGNIILVTAQPAWVELSYGDRNNYDTLASFIHDTITAKGLKLRLVLTGDLHHYSRYAPEGSAGHQLITAGGGGAFTHLTHNLPPDVYDLTRIERKWEGPSFVSAQANAPKAVESSRYKDTGTRQVLKAAYPDAGKSKEMLASNFQFGNRQMLKMLGNFWTPTLPVFLMMLLAAIWFECRLDLYSRTFWLFSFVSGLAWWFFSGRRLQGAIHGIIQMSLLSATTWAAIDLLGRLNSALGPASNTAFKWLEWEGAEYLFGALLVSLVCLVAYGFVSGLVLGCYFVYTNLNHRMHDTDASSALESTDFKNFLRLRITDKEITVYAIGIDQCLGSASDWIDKNPKDPENPQYFPAPGKALAAKLIEPPIIIKLN